MSSERASDKEYVRKPGGGRKPKPARTVFEAILYVLRTGCQWKALPRERFGSASAIHTRFLQWEKAGFFAAVWQAGLAECDAMEGIAWRWQSIDGAMMKAPLAQEQVGANPTDRGKKWKQATFAGRRAWGLVVARRDWSEPAWRIPTRIGAGGHHGETRAPVPASVEVPVCRCRVSGQASKSVIVEHGYIPHVKGRKQEAGELARHPNKRARRCIVEVAHSWFNRFRKLLVRYEKLERSFMALKQTLFSAWGCSISAATDNQLIR
ncbi:transposase [Georgfuchsia toluolica]|uniref:Transposase n=1 Tax=Georgfuchsia toluolica TaxID=424218 RepID=A0A916J5Z9_9PROT|nr:transposase [Georgfuchsia toluolica]